MIREKTWRRRTSPSFEDFGACGQTLFLNSRMGPVIPSSSSHSLKNTELYISKSQNNIFGIYRVAAHPDMLLFQYFTAATLIAAFFAN
jgi:hypothetical protein